MVSRLTPNDQIGSLTHGFQIQFGTDQTGSQSIQVLKSGSNAACVSMKLLLARVLVPILRVVHVFEYRD